MLSRYTVFFVASALPLLFAHQIAPSMAHELDFWLLWVVAMLVVGLPVLFAEFALSARSGDNVWLGMQKLTREADAKMTWRAFAGLSVLVALLISATMTARIGAGLHQHLPQLNLSVPSIGLSAGAMIIALILSLLKTRPLMIGVALVIVGGLISLFDGGLASGVSVPTMTAVSLSEWARAVSLALLSVGVGTGLYWFTGGRLAEQTMSQTHKKPLTGLILPIWLTQLIFGAFALLVGSAFVTPNAFVVSSIGMLLISAFLLYYAIGQLKVRFGLINGVAMGVSLAMILSALPAGVGLNILLLVSLVAVVVLSVFSGFAMKISHLRKTFNFKSEGRYNIWRVLVRIGVPLAILLAVIGWVMSWLS
ncbi:Uncharacterised protein [Moraxella lacunata]|uniref:Uncharacterized protein n=1 Tax=Moraxella lacunata TaxID=477 RepID=A0A378QIU0_MORLA|nr:hypothetical protein [Moraxella lacunata]STZ00809.1 Uncharacterised protein [Moraxella lacunata]